MKSIKILDVNMDVHPVMPRWRGKALAVHAPVRGGVCSRTGEWVVTHLASGHSAGVFGSLRGAVKAAREWDNRFLDVTAENAKTWPLREQWEALRMRAI